MKRAKLQADILSVGNIGDKEFPNVFKSLSCLLDSRPNGPRLTTNEQNEIS